MVAMGRPRGFDEEQAIAAAAVLFGSRSYDGTSVDDLVGETGVHRGSLYKAFGSKRGLYLAALRRYVDTDVTKLAERLAGSGGLAEVVRRFDDGQVDLGFLFLAAGERAAVDDEVAAEVARALELLDAAVPTADEAAPAVTALALGLAIRRRAGAGGSAEALLDKLER